MVGLAVGLAVGLVVGPAVGLAVGLSVLLHFFFFAFLLHPLVHFFSHFAGTAAFLHSLLRLHCFKQVSKSHEGEEELLAADNVKGLRSNNGAAMENFMFDMMI